MTNVILVNGRRQRKNPVLQHIKFVKKEFQDTLVADYAVGASVGVIWLSIKYHLLKPNYVRRRLAEIRGHYQLSILLLMVDEERSDAVIESLTLLCVSESVTVVCCWSNEEGARYLETFKVYEKKSAKMIQANVEGTYASQLTEFLTSIRSVTKRDVLTLITTFGTLKNIMQASLLQLSLCPGLGPTKCQNIFEAFHGNLQQPKILASDSRAPVTSTMTATTAPASQSSMHTSCITESAGGAEVVNSSSVSVNRNNNNDQQGYSGYSGDNP